MDTLVEYEDSDSEVEFLGNYVMKDEQISATTRGFPNKNMDSVSDINRQDVPSKGSSSHASWSSIRGEFVDMGYTSTMVDKAISIHGVDNWNGILEYLLACKAVDDSSYLTNLTTDPQRFDCEVEYNFRQNGLNTADNVHEPHGPKEARSEDIQADNIIAALLEMGYSENEVSSAIEINGIATPIDELVDFIDASLCDEKSGNDVHADLEHCDDKKQKKQDEAAFTSIFSKRKQADAMSSGLEIGSSSVQKRASGKQQKKVLKKDKHLDKMQSKQAVAELSDEASDLCFKGLTGFGVPGRPVGQRVKELKAFVQGPPFFYFENDVVAPKDVWKAISRHFGVEPEFVDSKYFSASKRPRGYVHNLPIDGRFQALPLPPMTIQEALPQTRKYWPSWDGRKKLNCICTGQSINVRCQELRSIIKKSKGEPSPSEQAYILENCKKWNLVWVGPDQVAPLEPHEIEHILGYDRDHTRGASTRKDRLQCLRNSFQVDTVAYHLSVLKPFYPDGLKVLSLFSGIGGAEVALHRIGIHLKCVVSVEVCPKNRLILSSWWAKTQQTGELIVKEDVQLLTRDVLEDLVVTVGGFDLIIGSSPCDSLSGNNKICRDGLDGELSSLFYEFPRILDDVRQIMYSKGTS